GGKKNKKIETVGCLDLEARIGEGGLGVVNLCSINEERVRGYKHLKLAEMWSQMTRSSGLYLPLKNNGNGNDEDEKTKRARNRDLIEEVMQEHSKEELIDLILDETRGKKYAVKFCNLKSQKSYTASDIESVRRFRREFELTNSLNLTEDEEEGNRNVVRLLFEEEESCLDNPEGRDKSRSGRIYYIMELLEGGDLAGKLEDAQDGVLEIHEAIGIILEVADALAYAHANKIIHRDMKPENIMFTKDGEVRVTDFGLGKDTSDKNATNLSRTGYAMGTPTYMPLEQARDAKHVKPNADIYSIGMTLYKMVVGSMPFELDNCRTMQQIADKLIENEGKEHEWLPFPDAQAGTQEDAFNKVILKSIQINPRLRYRKTEDFVADLERVWAWEEIGDSQKGIDISAIEKDIKDRQRQEWWNRRKLPIVGGGIGAVAAGLALAVAFLVGGGDPIGDALKQYETELTAIESLAKDGKLEDALRRAEALDKKINGSIKTGGDEAKQRLSKVDGRVEAAVAKYEIQTIVDTYNKRFDSAARLEDPLNREEQIRSLIQELEDFNRKKDSTEIAKLVTSKQTALEDAVESRIEAEIKSAYAKAQEFEQQGLLVEAFYEYERVTSEWRERDSDLQKKKVGAVYTGNELKHEEIAKRIWRLEGKDPAWRTLQFCVEEAKKRGD
ncbi:protein kinase, partial [Candidatus Woesearchaeota archaeon]|nr:protein kinase [Candidatus Woesearchaeota archaeon]